MVNGEGAGALVLESRRFAEARSAPILSTVLGGGRGFEPIGNGSSRRGAGIRSSIELSLASAQLSLRDVGHVNAHGISTVEGDRREANAIRDCLGDVPVTAPKSFFGNLGAGGGMVELVVSVLALQHGEVPVTLNYEFPDATCPVNVVHGQPIPVAQPTALVMNQSGTGQTAAVLIGEN